MDRRTFLSSLALLGLEGCFLDAHGAALLADRAAKGRKRRRGAPRFDDNLVCFISDLHVNPPGYQPARLERTIADILTLDPLPRNVIALGDLAYLTGRKEEYARLKEIIAPLEAAGIQLTTAGIISRKPSRAMPPGLRWRTDTSSSLRLLMPISSLWIHSKPVPTQTRGLRRAL